MNKLFDFQAEFRGTEKETRFTRYKKKKHFLTPVKKKKSRSGLIAEIKSLILQVKYSLWIKINLGFFFQLKGTDTR